MSQRKRERAFANDERTRIEAVRKALYGANELPDTDDRRFQPVVMASVRHGPSIHGPKRDRSTVRAAIAAGLARGRALGTQIPRIREREIE